MQTKANCKSLFNLLKQDKSGTPSHQGANWWDISPRLVSPLAKLGRAADIKSLSSCVVLSANGNGKEKKDVLSYLKSFYPLCQSQGSHVI